MTKGELCTCGRSISTTQAQKMTGLRSRVVVQGKVRLSTWQHCNSNTVSSLEDLCHCHHSFNDPSWRCCAVSWESRSVTMIAVYRFELKTDRYRSLARSWKKRTLASTSWARQTTVHDRSSEGSRALTNLNLNIWHQEHRPSQNALRQCSDQKVCKEMPQPTMLLYTHLSRFAAIFYVCIHGCNSISRKTNKTELKRHFENNGYNKRATEVAETVGLYFLHLICLV